MRRHPHQPIWPLANLCLLWQSFAAMRSLLVILFLFTACGVLHAQQQERKLLDRLDKPDLSATFITEKKGFTTKEFGGAHSAMVKEFRYVQKFTAKDFMTGTYGGAKSFWIKWI